VPGSDLADRCAEIAAGGRAAAAAPPPAISSKRFRARAAAPRANACARGTRQRVEINAKLSLFVSAETGRLDRKDSPNEAGLRRQHRAITVGMDWMPNRGLGARPRASATTRSTSISTPAAARRAATYTAASVTSAGSPTAALALNGYIGRIEGSNELKRAIDYTPARAARSVSALAQADPDSTRRARAWAWTGASASGAWAWQLGAGIDGRAPNSTPTPKPAARPRAVGARTRDRHAPRPRRCARCSRTMSTSWGVWQPQLKLGLRHEFANAARALTVRFVDDPNDTPIAFNTEDPDTSWGEWSLGRRVRVHARSFRLPAVPAAASATLSCKNACVCARLGASS
jgi:hypothetical protein